MGTAEKLRLDFSPQLQSTELCFRRKTTGMIVTAKMPGFLEQQICIWAQTKLHWFMLLTLSHKYFWHKRLPTQECLTAPFLPATQNWQEIPATPEVELLKWKLPFRRSRARKQLQSFASKQYLHHKSFQIYLGGILAQDNQSSYVGFWHIMLNLSVSNFLVWNHRFDSDFISIVP